MTAAIDRDREMLWSIEIVNWGAGPYIRETWGIRPDGANPGSAHWPREVREKPFPLTADEQQYDFESIKSRIAELMPEFDWIAIA